MAKQFRRLQRHRRLRLETLERRHLLAALTLTTTADGMVMDTNHDGVFDSVNSTSATISNRWFNPPTTPAQERGIFEFDLRDIAAGSTIDSASFAFHVQSFTSGDGVYPRFVLRAYAGDGAITLADATAPAITLGTGEIRSLGVNSVEVDAAVIQSLVGQRLTVRLENSEVMGRWASLSSLEVVSHGFRTQLLLGVSEPKPLDVQISPDGFWESAGAGAATGTVTRTGNLSQPLIVSLSSSDPSSATVPATVTIPAGSASATFPVDVVDDFFADGDKELTIAANASISASGPLALDNSYGIGGLAPTNLQLYFSAPQAAIAYLANGKVLAASQAGDSWWQVTRLNTDGTLDTSFGNNGVVITSLVNGSEREPIPTRIAIQPNGDFLVGGKFGFRDGRGILVRYKANGALDATFGTNGTANLNALHGSSVAGVSDIALRPDGRILLGFTENGVVSGVVAQLNPNGTFDSTFGSGGISRLHSLYGTGFSSSQIEILADGSFLVAGARGHRAGVVHVQPNGVGLVSSFGANGIALADFNGAVVDLRQMQLDSQGRIVFAGSASPVVNGIIQRGDFAAARFLPTGAPDLAFAGSGVKTVDITNRSSDAATSMVIQSNDKITIGGTSSIDYFTYSSLVQLNEDGTLDSAFDLDGRYRELLVDTFYQDAIIALALQADGNLLAVTGWETDVRIARFHLSTFLSDERTITVYDDDPTAYSSEYSIDEDRALIAPLLAIDPDDDPLQYSLVLSPASGTVTINNPATGSFTYVPNPNFHGSDSFTFRVNDGQANSNLATVVVTVNPVNDPPVVTPATFMLSEDSPVGTVVGTVVASDIEDDELSFSIVSGNVSNAFAIDAASGELRVANAAALDFSSVPVFPLIVRAVDAGGQSGQAEVSIFLTEGVGETTLDVQVSPDAFWESAGAGAATGTVTRTGDLSQPLVVSLSSSDPSSATVPATVTIPAGSASASFPIDAVDDFFADGDQVLTITASDTSSGLLTLNASYGVNGLASTNLRSSTQFAGVVLAASSDGRMLAASQANGSSWKVTRLNADGTVDTTFGTNGVVTTSLVNGNEFLPSPTKVAIQPNGDFLVGGRYVSGRSILVRYKADGALDLTFGFDGIANLSRLRTMYQDAAVSDIALRADGRILLGFTDVGLLAGAVAQLMPDGTFDSTFGVAGVSRLHLSYGIGFGASEIEILEDGSFLVAGAVQQRLGVARIQANGLGLVTSFGDNGIASADFNGLLISPSRMQRDDQGRIVISGSAKAVAGGASQPEDIVVARFLPSGVPDTSFADDGTKIIDIAGGSRDLPTSMVIQPGNKIVVGGASIVANIGASAVVRLNEDGTLDSTFDLDGLYRKPLVTTFLADAIIDLALRDDGNLLALAGWETDWRVASLRESVPVVAERTITVYDDDPTAYSAEFSIDEDRVLIAPLLAIDPDDDPLQYSLVSSAASGTVMINDEATGSFTYIPAPNFHGTDSFTFRVSDDRVNSNVATVVITVNPVNDPPVPMPGSFTLPEDAPAGTIVGTVVASDVEDDELSFSIVSGNFDDAFAIDAASGEIRVANVSALDFATTPFFPLVVRVVDASGLGGTAAISIFLTEVVPVPTSAAPVIGSFPTSVVKYTENGAAVVIGGGTVSDPDSLDFAGGTLTVLLSEGATANDRLGIKHTGLKSKQIGVDGERITYGTDGTLENAVAVATFSGGAGSEPLVIAFNSNARATHVTAVLKAITFRNTSEDPTAGPRQVSFMVTDGDGGTSEFVTRDLTVLAKNDAPVLAASASAVNYTEGDEPVVLDSRATVFDVDSQNFDAGKLTVRIASGAKSTDRLGIQSSGPISVNPLTAEVSYQGNVIGTFAGTTTLTVTLNAQATQEATQELLRRVTYWSVSKAPSTAPRSITLRLTDGDGGTSATVVAATAAITPVNDAPVISSVPSSEAKYTENAAPVAVAKGTVSDPDLLDFDGGTLTVLLSAGATADDRLDIKHSGFNAKQIGVDGERITYGTDGTPENAVTVATFSGGVGNEPLVITFNSHSLAAQVTAVLRAITFGNTSDDPVAGPRQISFVGTDGDGGTSNNATRIINVVAKNDAPVITAPASAVNYTEGGAPVVLASGATVLDVDSQNFDAGKLTVRIASGAKSTDRLGIQSSGPISVDEATSEVRYQGNVIGTFAGTTTLTVTLNALAAPEATQELLRRVTYWSISKAPSTTPRSITLRLTDGDGGTSATIAAATVAITRVNDAPVISSFPTSGVNYKANAAAVVIGGGTVSDPDLLDFDGGTLTVLLSAGAAADDRLGIKHSGFKAKQIGVDGERITYGTDGTLENAVTVATFSGGVGSEPLVIRFNSHALAAQVTAVLKAITFRSHSGEPSAGERQVSFELSDGDGLTSNTVSRSVKVIA